MMIAAVLALLVAGSALSGLRRWRSPRVVDAAWLLLVAGVTVGVVAGGRAVAGHGASLSLGSGMALMTTELHVDRLSGLFMVICFACAIPALLVPIGHARCDRARLPGVVGILLVAITLILASRNVFVLVFGWELLTFSFYLLTAYERGSTTATRAATLAAVFGKISGAGVLIGALLLAAQTHSLELDQLSAAAHGPVWQVAYAVLLFGFGVKVGLVPVQIWLPPCYTTAPGPARALMAGVAVNVGFYGWWRTLDILGRPPIWLVIVMLLLGGVTAILGIAHAAVSRQLTELIAWSSVENAGVIATGYATAMVGSSVGDRRLMAAGLLAGTAQVIAHALGKSLLFCSASAIEEATGTTDLNRLRGIGHQLPWAGTGLALGALTLAGMPLTAGLTSEWLTLEALMQQFRVPHVSVQLASAVAGALVALTVGVAGLTFVRLVGLTTFGNAAPTKVDRAVDRRFGVRAAVVLLITGCCGVSLLAPLEIRFIATGVSPLVGSTGYLGIPSPWLVQPVFKDFSSLSPTWMWIVIPGFTAAVLGLAWLFSWGRVFAVRRVPVWSSASSGVHRGLGYSSFGFANPMRKVLANLLVTRPTLETVDGVASGTEAPSVPASGPLLTYEVDVVEVVEQYVYRPLLRVLLAVVHLVKRLQSGRLDAYLAYMLIALVAVLALVTASN